MTTEQTPENDTNTTKPDPVTPAQSEKPKTAKSEKADIPPGVTYTNSYGVLQRVLNKVIEAPAPDKITQDFMGTVWGFTGGSGMAMIPLLKKLDFLSSDGVPTDHYRQFRTASGRNGAIRHALRKGYPDIYKQTDFAENAKDEKIADIVLGLTGRAKNDGTVKAILETFKVLKGFMNGAPEEEPTPTTSATPQSNEDASARREAPPYNLSYQINIVLPETKEVEVFDAIFRKLKEHLL